MMKRRSSGQGLVEMAIGLPIFLIAVMGAIDLGRAAYTYNGLSNVAREASHYAMLEYSTDSSSPCYWSSFNGANCLTAVKSYAIGLNMVPQLSSVNVSLDLLACQSACSGPSYPVTVSLATRFQPVSTSLIGVGPFDITASSTAQFVQPPSAGATPTPTPTTTGSETAPTSVAVATTNGCTSNCQEFAVTWTAPPNVDAIGHYELSYGTAGSYVYSGPEPARVAGNATVSSTVDLPNPSHSQCIEVTAVYSDGTQASAASGWYDSSGSPPNC